MIGRNKALWAFVCALAIAMACCVQPASAQSIGSAAVIKNDVHGVRGSATRVLATGGSVFSDDQVKTGDDSLAQLVFLDQTNLTVAANSQAVLREVYRPKQGYSQLIMKTVAGSFRYVSGVQSSHRDVVQFPQGYLTVRGTTVDIVAGRTRTLIILIEGAITVVPFATRIPHDLSVPGTSLIVYNDGHVDGPMTREAALEKMHLKVATEFSPATKQVSWTGWYVGGNAGYSWGKVDGDFNAPGFPGLSEGNSPPPPGSFPTSLKPNGFIGGGQIGYNWQLDRSVFSLEADFQGSAERNGISFDNLYSCESVGFLGCVLAQTRDAKILWFGTVRGRIGWLFTPTLLFYGTGGLAYGKVSAGGTISNPDNADFGTSFSFAVSKVTIGYAAGAGIEGAILNSRDWTWRIEYLYLNLGSLSGSGTEPITGSAYNWDAKFSDNIVRVGLNYRFH